MYKTSHHLHHISSLHYWHWQSQFLNDALGSVGFVVKLVIHSTFSSNMNVKHGSADSASVFSGLSDMLFVCFCHTMFHKSNQHKTHKEKCRRKLDCKCNSNKKTTLHHWGTGFVNANNEDSRSKDWRFESRLLREHKKNLWDFFWVKNRGSFRSGKTGKVGENQKTFSSH